MLVYPNAKINIGLCVTEKRSDGFHNLETVFYPVGLSDILELHSTGKANGSCKFRNTGLTVDCPDEKNLVVKAYRLLASDYDLPSVEVHLHKMIPFGAGLGGGSADAAFMLKALNEYFELRIENNVLANYASKLGSDCAFFIYNESAFASGKGDILEKLDLSLKNYTLVLVKPDCGVSTAEAYAGITPAVPLFDLRGINRIPVKEWKNNVVNDFEKTVSAGHPEIAAVKRRLYDSGAVYVSMTGSGSAVFALFEENPVPDSLFPGYFVWQEQLQ